MSGWQIKVITPGNESDTRTAHEYWAVSDPDSARACEKALKRSGGQSATPDKKLSAEQLASAGATSGMPVKVLDVF